MKRLAALAAIIFATSAVGSDVLNHPERIRLPDIARMEALDGTLGRTLRDAFASENNDLTYLVGALGGAPVTEVTAGDWDCRWIKMGSLVPLAVYQPFRCRITPDGEGWILAKTTGSQKFTGRLDWAIAGLVYTGVGYVGGSPATDYTGLPPTDQAPVEPNQTYAQVGLFEPVSATEARLLLPSPILESDFDIIHFTRGE